jgi:predicted GNAT family acetyltransferase
MKTRRQAGARWLNLAQRNAKRVILKNRLATPICQEIDDLPAPHVPRKERSMTDTLAASTVRDDKVRSRFELDVNGAIAFANYRLAGDRVIITHTETPPALRGRGIASELVKGALELIRADGHKVVAGCSFVVDYLAQHPEVADLKG